MIRAKAVHFFHVAAWDRLADQAGPTAHLLFFNSSHANRCDGSIYPWKCERQRIENDSHATETCWHSHTCSLFTWKSFVFLVIVWEHLRCEISDFAYRSSFSLPFFFFCFFSHCDSVNCAFVWPGRISLMRKWVFMSRKAHLAWCVFFCKLCGFLEIRYTWSWRERSLSNIHTHSTHKCSAKNFATDWAST